MLNVTLSRYSKITVTDRVDEWSRQIVTDRFTLKIKEEYFGKFVTFVAKFEVNVGLWCLFNNRFLIHICLRAVSVDL